MVPPTVAKQCAARRATNTRPTPSFCRPDADQLISRWRRCGTKAGGSLDLSRSCQCSRHLLVPVRGAGTDEPCRPAIGQVLGGSVMRRTNDLAVLIKRWFTDRLMKHQGVSSNTIASYRDTFRLLFCVRIAPAWQITMSVDTAGFGRSFHRRIPGGSRDEEICLGEDPEFASQPSDPSSDMRRSRSRHIAPIFSVCSRSPASDVTSGSFSF